MTDESRKAFESRWYDLTCDDDRDLEQQKIGAWRIWQSCEADLAAANARIAELEREKEIRDESIHSALDDVNCSAFDIAYVVRAFKEDNDSLKARLAAANAKIAELERECFALAANSCCVKGGLVGDDGGTPYCTLQKRLAANKEPTT